VQEVCTPCARFRLGASRRAHDLRGIHTPLVGYSASEKARLRDPLLERLIKRDVEVLDGAGRELRALALAEWRFEEIALSHRDGTYTVPQPARRSRLRRHLHARHGELPMRCKAICLYVP